MQFGIHGDPAVSAAWAKATITSDRSRASNTRGRITFAMAMFVNTRSTQAFITYGDNSRKLDADGFAPFGEVIVGMVVLDRVNTQYGEGADQRLILAGGNIFLAQTMPHLDFVKTATIVDK